MFSGGEDDCPNGQEGHGIAWRQLCRRVLVGNVMSKVEVPVVRSGGDVKLSSVQHVVGRS